MTAPTDVEILAAFRRAKAGDRSGAETPLDLVTRARRAMRQAKRRGTPAEAAAARIQHAHARLAYEAEAGEREYYLGQHWLEWHDAHDAGARPDFGGLFPDSP